MAEAIVTRLDVSDRDVARELIALQRRSYRVEADLIGSESIPALDETLDQLQESGETFLGACFGSALAGFVSWKLEDRVLDLHRLVVDPSFFRRGVGSLLVEAALGAEPAASRAIVQTGRENEPAVALYRRHGFRKIGEREVAPHVFVALLERELP